MKLQRFSLRASEAGYTLITTLVIALAMAVMMTATLSRTYSGAKLNDRNNAYLAGTAAAEAATEKAMACMMIDFANGGFSLISNNLTYYMTSSVPLASENSYWTNWQFSDARGNNNRIYVGQYSTNSLNNLPYVQLETEYPGLFAFAATYRVLANASMATNTVGSVEHYNFTNAVCQDVQMAEIPVFQFAIFYNGLMEFTDCAPFTINGRVQCNSNIYVGCPNTSSSLTFNYFVNASGTITNPSWYGESQSSFIATQVTYHGSPSPGYGTGSPVLTLPMGAATNSPIQIINFPTNGEDATITTNALSQQRFWYKAGLRILVTNVSATIAGTVCSNTITTLNFRSGYSDLSPLTVNFTNYSPGWIVTNSAISNGVYQMNTNWASWFGPTNISNPTNTSAANWLNIGTTFYDARQGQTNRVTQINVTNFGIWIATNTNVLSKWGGAGSPFNGIIYVADMRTTNGQYMDAVRLTNGQVIPSIGATNLLIGGLTNNTYAYTIPGFTVATINPLYICGNYNCPSNTAGTTNVTGTQPCSVVCDALTILSSSWKDTNVVSSIPSASSADTVNTAIIAGNVPSTGSASTQYSGGVNNLTRLLENWTGDTLWLNTSIINLYASAQATQQFQAPGNYYDAPTRQFAFDFNFQTSGGLPPGTPLVNRMIRADWFVPPPCTTNITYSPTLSFVPQ
jgi:hypothetical protein